MTDRSDEGERVAVVAKLRPGSRGRASEILAEGVPYELGETGFRRHSVFLAGETVIFLFEGSGIEGLVRDLVNDPVRSAAFSIWGPLLEGTPACPGGVPLGSRLSLVGAVIGRPRGGF